MRIKCRALLSALARIFYLRSRRREEADGTGVIGGPPPHVYSLSAFRARCEMFGLVALLAGGCATLKTGKPSSESVRITSSFDTDWQFLKADAPGAEEPGFDDQSWRKLDVPHDWSIESPFDEKNPAGGAGAFLPAGVGWYRKHFTLPASFAGRRVFIEFDGVMANSDVWINGQHLGKRPFGYASFSYELTPHLNFGAKPNVLAVRADNSQQPASRWYAGAGIYRHVRLVATDSVHVEQWGAFVTTPQVAKDQATVHVQCTVANQSDAARKVGLQIEILDPGGKIVATADTQSESLPAGKSTDFQQDLVVKRPQLWNLDNHALYRAVAKVRTGGRTLDDETVPFGIRHFEFNSDTGFWLNGKNFKLKGVCLHHDVSPFGAAVPLRAWERRLEILKQFGVNAVRTAHNPPSQEFLDLCDRMGLLVMDEPFDCWTVAKNRYDYHLYFNEWSKIDARDMVRRDRNHPSIILYSAGNEIHDTPRPQIAIPILKGLVEVFHENDPTRPVTQALFRPNVSHDYTNGLADLLDVIGTNYRDNELLAAWRAKPGRKIVGTEQRHERETWLYCRDNPQHSGQFLWSGVDYMGESRRWPAVTAGSGLLDRTSAPRSLAYERASWWLDQPMVHATRRVAPQQRPPADPGFQPLERAQVLFPDWTPRNAAAHEENVEIYSNCEQVELFLNGKSLGSKPLPANATPRNWRVQYVPGVLKAVGENKGRIVATHELRTAGEPAKIILAADRASLAGDWDDVSHVTVSVVDKNGVLVPSAGNLIRFRLTGRGEIAGVDNGDRASHESFQANERSAYGGCCIAVVRAKPEQRGSITLKAESDGLRSGKVRIKSK
jgi:beta-galactosidase